MESMSTALDPVAAVRTMVTFYGVPHSDRGSNTVWQAAWTAPWFPNLSVPQVYPL